MTTQGMEVDDDNEPAPENIPQPNEPLQQSVFSENWGFEGIDFHRASGGYNMGASLNGVMQEAAGYLSPLSLFDVFSYGLCEKCYDYMSQ